MHIIVIYIYGRIPEWLKGTDCKSVVFDFDGSNPSPPTNKPLQSNPQGFIHVEYLFAAGEVTASIIIMSDPAMPGLDRFVYTSIPYNVIIDFVVY